MNLVNYEGRSIDIDKVNELADCAYEGVAEYYQRVQSFLENIEVNNPTLSAGQDNWLNTIVDNLDSQHDKSVLGL